MATHAYIFAQEEFIRWAGESAKCGEWFPIDVIRTVLEDCTLSHQAEVRYMTNGAAYPENADPWGTLGVNASILALHCPELREECIALCRQLGQESGLRDLGLIPE